MTRQPHPITWIICHGRIRDVRGGWVDCPEVGAARPIGACRACRHLETLAGERSSGWECTVPEPISRVADPPR